MRDERETMIVMQSAVLYRGFNRDSWDSESIHNVDREIGGGFHESRFIICIQKNPVLLRAFRFFLGYSGINVPIGVIGGVIIVKGGVSLQKLPFFFFIF